MTAENGGVATPAASHDNAGFLTKEQLQDRARFKFEVRTLEMPELGGGKVGLRGLSVGRRESLTSQLPDDPAKWQRKHTALSLSKYVNRPELTVDEWTEIIKPWPSAALDRINREIFEIVNVGVEEENAAGMDFRTEDD